MKNNENQTHVMFCAARILRHALRRAYTCRVYKIVNQPKVFCRLVQNHQHRYFSLTGISKFCFKIDLLHHTFLLCHLAVGRLGQGHRAAIVKFSYSFNVLPIPDFKILYFVFVKEGTGRRSVLFLVSPFLVSGSLLTTT